MPTVSVIDTTLRDAHQCLWATRMTTAMMLPIAHVMDRIGFEAIDLMGGVTFDACVRYLQENPWERIRLMRQRVQRTPLHVIIRGRTFIAFGVHPDEMIELTVKRLAANGIRWFTPLDGNNDYRNLEAAIRAAKDAGMRVTGPLVFSVSPVHTDAYFVQKTRELAGMGVHAILIKDANGVLTPDRVRTLVPAVRQAAGTLPLQIHTHCMTGLAPICLLEAIQLGVQSVYTAISPLAHGASHTPTELMVRNAKRLGFTVDLDEEGLKQMAEHFTRVAIEHGKPLGRPVEYDVFHYQHQIPGGMISNFRFQLSQLGAEDRLEEILEETVRVREDMGWTVMISPYSQHIATQAALNVLYGRYAVVPDEIRLLALGYYGATPAPVKQEVLDKVAPGETPITVSPGELVPPILDKIRKEHGPFNSDDDLVLAAALSPGILKRLYAAGPIRTEYISARTPLALLVKEVAKRRDIKRLHLMQKPKDTTNHGLQVMIKYASRDHDSPREIRTPAGPEAANMTTPPSGQEEQLRA